jgi:hypothetical protein
MDPAGRGTSGEGEEDPITPAPLKPVPTEGGRLAAGTQRSGLQAQQRETL